MSVRAIKAGASDFLTKPISKEVLFDAIERAVERYLVVGEQQAQLNALRGLVAALSPRQRQVFGLVVQGRLNKQIAYELGVTERTVKAHRERVMLKTKAETTAELVLIAERLGITTLNTGAHSPRSP
jgi:FixJ family two-component response regulator